jgi:hypothetical protein
VCSKGIIEVRRLSNRYIGKPFNSQNSYIYAPDLTSAQTYSLPPKNFVNTPIDIAAANGPSSQPLLGSIGGSGGFFFVLG